MKELIEYAANAKETYPHLNEYIEDALLFARDEIDDGMPEFWAIENARSEILSLISNV